MIETKKDVEKTVLVYFAVKDGKNTNDHVQALEELRSLAETAGADVIKTYYQFNDNYDSRYMIGKGKVKEIAEYVEEHKVSLVVFEDELTYTHLRNLETEIKCKILDKSSLILDIFARNYFVCRGLFLHLARIRYKACLLVSFAVIW